MCPVYERTGGHAYGSVYPGPIGAILSPQLTGIADNASLPYASTLCGACYDVCPVRIDIPSILVHLRNRQVDRTRPATGALAARRSPWPPRRGRWPARAGSASRELALRLGRLLGRGGRIRRLPPPLSAWTDARDLPVPPAQTFRQWWRTRDGDHR